MDLRAKSAGPKRNPKVRARIKATWWKGVRVTVASLGSAMGAT